MTNPIKWLLLSFALLLSTLFGRVAQAKTITAASCSQADVQAVVTSAANGDTVVVPGPCTATWASVVNVPAVGMTIQPSGSVIINSFGFSVNGTSSNLASVVRITGFTFTDPGAGHALILANDPSVAPIRVDHNTFSTGGLGIFVYVYGAGVVLFDNNTFIGGDSSEFIHLYGHVSDTLLWQDNITPGGPNFTFLEDNTCTGTSLIPGHVVSLAQGYNGARFVARHNQMNFCQNDAHGTAGAVGNRWFEIYQNVYNTPSTQSNGRYMDLRGGSGVVWGNSQTGNDAGFITFREEDTGTWPLAYMAGSGINGTTDGHNSCAGGTLNSAPVQVWANNGIPVNTAQGSPTLGRDYFVTAGTPGSLVFNWMEASTDTCSTTYNYVPYPYPHPLQGGGGIPPAPPTTLSAVVQ